MDFDLEVLIREREDQIQQLLGEVRLLKAMQAQKIKVSAPDQPVAGAAPEEGV